MIRIDEITIIDIEKFCNYLLPKIRGITPEVKVGKWSDRTCINAKLYTEGLSLDIDIVVISSGNCTKVLNRTHEHDSEYSITRVDNLEEIAVYSNNGDLITILNNFEVVRKINSIIGKKQIYIT